MNQQTPIWQTATNEQLKHTMFKVTYKSGGIFIGYLTVENRELVPVLGDVGNVTGLYVTHDERNRLCDFVQSIEVCSNTAIPLTSRDEYVREEKMVHGYIMTSYDGSPAIVVLKNGNCGKIAGCKDYKLVAQFTGNVFDGSIIRNFFEDELVTIPSCEIDYYLVKKKPQLPNKSGLWKDKDGDIWLYSTDMGDMTIVRQCGIWVTGGECITFDYARFREYAPFTPWNPDND